jgi:hypothetical protein
MVKVVSSRRVCTSLELIELELELELEEELELLL